MLTENTPLLEDPPSPIERHVKWKMARTKRYGQITSKDSLQEQMTQGSFVPHGRDDILNTAIGRPEHPGCVRVAGSGVMINQYYGRASRGSSSSSISITRQQLADIIGSLKEKWRNEIIGNLKEEVRHETEEENKQSLEKLKQELKDDIKVEFSKMGSQYSPFLEALGARVSTKGSNSKTTVNPSGEEHDGRVIPTMGLYVQRENCIVLVALGKIYKGGIAFTTWLMPMMWQALQAFIAWPTNLVKLVSEEESHISPKKLHEPVQRANNVSKHDPLRQLIKSLYDIYEKPVELMWDATKFGIPNVDASFFLTYSDVNEIITGDKFFNIAILQLWMMFMDEWSSSLCHASVYGFLEPQSIHHAKDRHAECEQAHWQLLVLCPRNNVVAWFYSLCKKPNIYIKTAINNAMKTLKTAVDGKNGEETPKWIEVKSHVQSKGYECGYYMMHWMWNIVKGDLKNDWSMWFADGTSLDMETITTICKKWTAYFVKVQNIRCRKP
ncbi:hypothetical protein GmHk_10G028733 [Glycine max]|nr:hypothetical protein GmHk_10G028733 [Glycine max]